MTLHSRRLASWKSWRGAGVLLLLAGALAPACGHDRTAPSDPSPPGDTVPAGHTAFRWGGRTRNYLIRLPSRQPSARLPLVLALHGYTGTAAGMERGSGFTPLADTAGFVVAYPNAIDYMWNAGGPYRAWTSVDDVGFLSALIDTLVARQRVDPKRVFVTGHSNGGYMAYHLAHMAAPRIAAIAPVAGLEYATEQPEPAAEVALMHLHALDDATVLYAGGVLGGTRLLAVDSSTAIWIARNHCAQRPDTLVNADGVLARRWRSASGRGDVLLQTSGRGGHAWPQQASWGFSGSAAIWAFFRDVPPR